jgi:hypothetical protein
VVIIYEQRNLVADLQANGAIRDGALVLASLRSRRAMASVISCEGFSNVKSLDEHLCFSVVQ